MRSKISIVWLKTNFITSQPPPLPTRRFSFSRSTVACFSPMSRGVPIFPDTLRNLKPMFKMPLPSSCLCNVAPPAGSSSWGSPVSWVGAVVVGVALQHLPTVSISVNSSRFAFAQTQPNSCWARLVVVADAAVVVAVVIVVVLLQFTVVVVAVVAVVALLVLLLSLRVLVERDSMAMVRTLSSCCTWLAVFYVSLSLSVCRCLLLCFSVFSL